MKDLQFFIQLRNHRNNECSRRALPALITLNSKRYRQQSITNQVQQFMNALKLVEAYQKNPDAVRKKYDPQIIDLIEQRLERRKNNRNDGDASRASSPSS